MLTDCKSMWMVFFVCLLALCPPAHAQTDKRQAESTASQSLEFGARGTIQIVDSYGSVKIEGWDKEEVELTVMKKTQKKYESKDLSKAERELERVKVAMELIEENAMLVIYTKYPSWTPLRMFGGKTNLNLSYIIRVPRRSTLFIKHGIGEVSVTNVSGDIQATASIGEINLRLPEENSYAVNARARIGDVSSEFGPITQRQGPFSVGAKLEGEPAASTRRVYLRVGIGDIQVTKLTLSSKPDEKGVTK